MRHYGDKEIFRLAEDRGSIEMPRREDSRNVKFDMRYRSIDRPRCFDRYADSSFNFFFLLNRLTNCKAQRCVVTIKLIAVRSSARSERF